MFSLACFLLMAAGVQWAVQRLCNKTGFGSYIELSKFIVSPLLLICPSIFRAILSI